MAKSSKGSVGRRGFLKGAAAGAAAIVAQPSIAGAHAPQAEAARPAAVPPSQALAARETGPPPQVTSRHIESPQSDYMVDVIRALDLKYVAANPGSSFEGLHESLVNYGEGQPPEFITCLHEESSVAMAHGYAKASGKPMLALLHGVIGIQHAAMSIYNAYCDRAPVIVDSGFRRGGDIFKALALGATAVGVGRPYIWGLTAFGQEGVETVLELLRRELQLVMRQSGVASIKGITRTHVVRG